MKIESQSPPNPHSTFTSNPIKTRSSLSQHLHMSEKDAKGREKEEENQEGEKAAVWTEIDEANRTELLNSLGGTCPCGGEYDYVSYDIRMICSKCNKFANEEFALPVPEEKKKGWMESIFGKK
eukprot:TRINITY_DN3821_c0_g1_i3.p1 TRINITY_DN3821_c0_g1~~TRINITY_DN3821_c0_g1_i3.p1  ORF type:complete len:123 (+),score=30.16 TRINITY_DN3821_c0_g1_i3:338-706(+)